MFLHSLNHSLILSLSLSVLQRSPPELLSEIILIDDFSDNRTYLPPRVTFDLTRGSLPTAEDGQLLTPIPKLRVVRMRDRSGLMRARVKGAELAVGPVLTFLDSHCEVTTGWLQPLLSRIKTVSLSLSLSPCSPMTPPTVPRTTPTWSLQ